MSSFSNILQSIKNPDTHTTTTPKPAIKTIKIANNGSHIKNVSDVVEAASKRTAPVVQQQAVEAAPKANLKKRKADDTYISAAKPIPKKPKTKMPVVKERNKLDLPEKERDIPSLNTKTTAERLSLERMKEDALRTLVEQRGVAQMALDGLLPLVEKSKVIETAVAVLEQQIEAYNLNIKKLSLLGREFDLGRIKGTDSQTLLALASWGLDVKTAFEDVTSSPLVKATKPAVKAKAYVKVEVEDTRFSDETLATIFGPDEEKVEEDVKYDIVEMAPISASFQRPVTSTAAPTTNSRPAPCYFVDPTKAHKLRSIDVSEAVDAMEKAAMAEKKQSPKKRGGFVVQNGGGTKSKVYRNEDRELRFRKYNSSSSCQVEEKP